MRMIHHREGLPLLLEARDDFLRIHAQLDDLQCDAAPHGLFLIRHPDGAETTLADLFHQFIRADLVADFLGLEARELGFGFGGKRGFTGIARFFNEGGIGKSGAAHAGRAETFEGVGGKGGPAAGTGAFSGHGLVLYERRKLQAGLQTVRRESSGEHTRPACWRRRPAFANLPAESLPSS